MQKVYAYYKLSDTIETRATLTAPGFRYPGSYPWNDELKAHVLDNRLFDLSKPEDVEAFNAAGENHCRAAHEWRYPIAVVMVKTIESGFDEPETVVIETPLPPPPAPEPAPEPIEPARSIPPPATAAARKKAQQLSVDLETLRGQGTGTGGLITKEDVEEEWRKTGGQGLEIVTPGPIRMSELLQTAEP